MAANALGHMMHDYIATVHVPQCMNSKSWSAKVEKVGVHEGYNQLIPKLTSVLAKKLRKVGKKNQKGLDFLITCSLK